MENDNWLTYPCSKCQGTPCCNWVPVATLKIDTFTDVCKAMRLLYFKNIQLGLYDSGKWMVYFQSSCCHYDLVSTRCLIHSTAQRPGICEEYKAADCWYVQHFLPGGDLRFVRFNLQRFLLLCKALTYLPNLQIDFVPQWEEILKLVTPFPWKLKGPLQV